MFEKEIIIKDSYLEVILKVLTEISNYVLIGYFQILCNFYDENNDLFYTISLSTAMGSTNKFNFESKRKDTSLVITRSFQYFFEYRHQL